MAKTPIFLPKNGKDAKNKQSSDLSRFFYLWEESSWATTKPKTISEK